MNLKEIERNIIGVCQEVGEFIYAESQNFDLTHIEQKDGFNNLVSYVDKEAERRLVSACQTILS